MVDLKSGLEIEVLSAADAARRRPWSEAEKLRIVEASFAGRRLVSATARSARDLAIAADDLAAAVSRGDARGGQATSFAPLLMAPEVASRPEQASGADRIEIVLANGRRLIVGAGRSVGAGAGGPGAGAGMIAFPAGVKVWLAGGVTDMRKGMNSLALLVQEGLGRDPHAGELFCSGAGAGSW